MIAISTHDGRQRWSAFYLLLDREGSTAQGHGLDTVSLSACSYRDRSRGTDLCPYPLSAPSSPEEVAANAEEHVSEDFATRGYSYLTVETSTSMNYFATSGFRYSTSIVTVKEGGTQLFSHDLGGFQRGWLERLWKMYVEK